LKGEQAHPLPHHLIITSFTFSLLLTFKGLTHEPLMSLLHDFTSAKPDTADATKVQPSHWNAAHKSSTKGVMYAPTDASNIASVSAGQNYLNYLRRKFNASASEEYEFAALSTLTSTDFNFTAQSPATNLTAGITNTVTLTPVPLGIAGSNVKHYVRIVDAIGGNEVVLITGGTATTGAASGTITFVPTLNHTSGNYTIVSATAGIQEALYSQTRPHVKIPSATYTVYAQITTPQGCMIEGSGLAQSSSTTSATTINYPSTTGKLFNVENDQVTLKHMHLVQTGGTATAGAAISVLPPASAVMIQDVEADYFYDGFSFIGTSGTPIANVSLGDLIAASSRRYGFHFENTSGAARTLLGTFSTSHGLAVTDGFSPLFQNIMSFNNGGYGVYLSGTSATIQISTGTFQADYAGAIYLNSGYAAGCQLNNINVQSAGTTNTWGTNTSAPGIRIASTSQPVVLNNVQIQGCQGNGIWCEGQNSTIIGVFAYQCGLGAQAGHLYGVRLDGNFSQITGANIFQGSMYVSAAAAQIVNNTIVAGGATAAITFAATAIHTIFSDNFIFNAVGNAITIDSGASCIVCVNSVEGTVSGTFDLSARNNFTVSQTNTATTVGASGTLVLTTSIQDVPGATLTLARAGKYFVQGVFDIRSAAGDAGQTISGRLTVGATDQATVAVFIPPNSDSSSMANQQWLIQVAAGTVIKLRAIKTGGAGASFTAAHTTLTAIWVEP
jgi:hypothetical protein